jgi:sugar phosphate isomerase/epimerase
VKLGAQLFTLREFVKTAEGFRETLRRVAEIGYDGVQISAVEAFESQVSPEETRAWLDEFGLTCCATHRPWNRIQDENASEIAIHQTIGCHHIGVGMAPKSCYDGGSEGWHRWVSELPSVIDALETEGLHFCFHNHAI